MKKVKKAIDDIKINKPVKAPSPRPGSNTATLGFLGL